MTEVEAEVIKARIAADLRLYVPDAHPFSVLTHKLLWDRAFEYLHGNYNYQRECWYDWLEA